jgi:hypothetical protein
VIVPLKIHPTLLTPLFLQKLHLSEMNKMRTQRYWLILTGLLILLLIIFYLKSIEAQDPTKSQEPIVGEPVTPSTSQSVRDLPTITPLPPNAPIHEINPRQHPPVEPSGQSQATSTAPADQN